MSEVGSTEPGTAQKVPPSPAIVSDPVGKLHGTDEDANGRKGRSKTVFPPPSSWYQSHLADSRSDMWAYSSQNGIVVVRARENSGWFGASSTLNEVNGVDNPNLDAAAIIEGEGKPEKKEISRPTTVKHWPDFSFLEGKQGTKVTSVSFCKAAWSNLPVEDSPLVSSCESGLVRIWNLKTNSTQLYTDAHEGHQSLVQWSPKDPSLIYTIDSQGNLSVWNLEKNTLTLMNFGKISPTCLAISPSEDNIAAIGTKAGNVLIVNTTGNGTILSKMRHEEEVCQVSWKPEGHWGAIQDSDNYKQPFLISSISSLKPPTIRVWDREGKDVAIIRPWEKESKDRKLAKSYVPSAWAIDPNSGALCLCSAGIAGEIISWSESSTRADVIHELHVNYAIFCTIQCGDILWSLSHEPVIIGWNLRAGQVECIIPTFRGVSSIVQSPVELSQFAIGGMDGCIRVLSIGSGYPDLSPLRAPTVTARLKGKITSLAWHPSREHLVGFGTDEGVIGVYEHKLDNKFAMMFDRRIHGTVYTVSFGPQTYTTDFKLPAQKEVGGENHSDGQIDSEKDGKAGRDLMLYACGGNSVFMIHPSRHFNSLIRVTNIIYKTNEKVRKNLDRNADNATDIGWTPDLKYFVVGYNDGRIEIYSPPFLQLRCWIVCHFRSIQFFAWRMQDFYDTGRETKWFASASNDGNARIHNLNQLYTKEFLDNPEAAPIQVISSQATLNGHGGMRVICLSWSPHDENLLVTVSYDRTAVVWNAAIGDQIARYTGHQHRLVTCYFHPQDKYKVITGSDEIGLDYSIHVWDYRQYPCSPNSKKYQLVDLMPKKSDPIKAQLKCIGKIVLPEQNDSNSCSVEPKMADRRVILVQSKPGDKPRPKPKSKPKSIMPLTSNALFNTKQSLYDELRYIVSKVPMPAKKFAPVETGKPPIDFGAGGDMVDQTEKCTADTEILPELHLGVLGSSEDVNRLIMTESDFHLRNANWEYSTHLSNWAGEPTKTIQEAIKQGHVSETMVAIAASYSPKLYREAVEALVAQLVQRDEHYKAATYLLLIEKVQQAVRLLLANKMYREALLLAKSRFPLQMPIVTEIQDKWVQSLVAEGNFELACKINSSLGRYGDALANIERRNNLHGWKASIYVAIQAQDKMKAEAFGVKYLEDRIILGEFAECREVIAEFPLLKWMLPIVLIHEYLTEVSGHLLLSTEDSLTTKVCEVACSFDEEIKKKWKSEGMLDEDPEFKIKIKTQLNLTVAQNFKEAILIEARYITLLLFKGELDEKKELGKVSCDLMQMWLEKVTTTKKNTEMEAIGQVVLAVVRKLSNV